MPLEYSLCNASVQAKLLSMSRGSEAQEIGAGGTWPRSAEINDPAVRAQLYSDSCGPACGALTLLLRNLLLALEQELEEHLYELVGRGPSTETSLADALNETINNTEFNDPVIAPILWKGSTMSPGQGTPRDLLAFLVGYTPWIAHVRDHDIKKMGHFVVVAEIADESIRILDPWNPGTKYSMTVDDFYDHWTGGIVYPPRKGPPSE